MELNPDNVKWRGSLTAIRDERINTDKVILPQSILENLVNQASMLPTPLTFRLKSGNNNKYTHVGVSEFSSEEGFVYLPKSVGDNLEIEKESMMIDVEFKVLPKASGLKIKPLLESDQHVDDYKVMLEAQLNRTHTALTKGDVLTVSDPLDIKKGIRFLVEQVKPADAVCIVDTDVDLEVSGQSNVQVGDEQQQKEINIEETVSLKIHSKSNHLLELKQWDNSRELKFVIETNIEESTVNAFIGIDDTTSESSFIWSTLLSSLCNKSLSISPHDPFIKGQPHDDGTTTTIPSLFVCIRNDHAADTAAISVSATQTSEQIMDTTTTPDDKQCPNCHQSIPPQSFTLHTTFCQRNNITCSDCNRVFSKREGGIPSTHWHCIEHLINGDTESSKDLHDFYYHEQTTCSSCGEAFSNQIAASHHRQTSCPSSLHICRFCHLKIPREETSATDAIEGLSGHESRCGVRTTDCPKCNVPVRLKELTSHMKFHDYQRLENIKPQICTNINCSKLSSSSSSDTTNPLNLCGFCYGPLHTQAYDSDNKKLKSRIERRYVIQLTQGCGRTSCMNSYCASGTGKKLSISEAMPIVRQLLTERWFAFCVDEMTTKRKLIVDELTREGEYDQAWCTAAVENSKGKEPLAREWLHNNAIKIIEQ